MPGATFVLDERGEKSAHCFQIGDEPRLPQQSAPAAPPARAIPVAPTPSARSLESLSGRNLIKSVRARIRVLNRDIKKLETLRKERDQLKRLLSAAETERDNVRRIRSAG